MTPRFVRTVKAKDLQVGDILVESAGKGITAYHDEIIAVETAPGVKHAQVLITTKPLYGGPKNTKPLPQATSRFFAENRILISVNSPRYK